MIHQSKDDAFINSAYLSELWACRDLQRLKSLQGNRWTDSKEQQLQDEVRHAAMLLAALKASGSWIVTELKFSMQEKLYRPLFNLAASRDESEGAVIHNLTEHRAVWIYKTYLKVSPHSSYRKVILEIMADEKRHFDLNTSLIRKDRSLLEIKATSADRLIFRKLLQARYGRIIFDSERFWTDYYADSALFTDDAPNSADTASADVSL